MFQIFQLLYEPIQFNHESLTLNTTENQIMIDAKCIENDFEKLSFRLDGIYYKNKFLLLIYNN